MYKITIDLGATKILAGIMDENNTVLSRKSTPTRVENGAENAVKNTAQIVNEQLEALSISKDQCRAGACAPGPIDIDKGRMVNSVNMHWGIIPLRDMLSDALGLPVVLEHDAKASAVGEFHYGVGANEKLQSMVYIVVGSGVGGAIIIDGKMYRGLHNYAGELGHFTIDYDGDSGLTDIPGNVQSFMAGPSQAHRYVSRLKEKKIQAPAFPIDGKAVEKLARENDPHALHVIHEAGKALGVTVASLAMILDIDVYVIGSSVSKLGEMLFAPARETVFQYAFADVAKNIRIMESVLGDDAALLGCAHIAEFGL